jgi:6-phosphogluconolactonase (cycloisomerase 2 family)
MVCNPSIPFVGLVSLLVLIFGCADDNLLADAPVALSSGDSAQPIQRAKTQKEPQSAPPAELTLIEHVRRSDLAKVVRTELSPDGKFLYAICWNPGTLVAFSRDLRTGKLTHIQTVGDNPELAGGTGLALSPDGRFAVVAAFRSKAIILFRRDHDSGKVTRLAPADQNGQNIEFPVAATFSPDGKFVCVADHGARPGSGAVRVYKLEGEKLIGAAMDQGRNDCYSSARNLAFHPNGKTLFVASWRPGSLVVADFNRDTGAVKVRQVLWAASNGDRDFSKSDVGEVAGIQGVIDVVTGPDGRFVTTSSGRFGGPTAVTSFKYGDDGLLSFVKGEKGSGARFSGGNQLAVSPDGKSIYAAGTLSGMIACVARDPQTGNLTPGGVIPDGAPPGEPGKTMSPSGITISPDGKFVYVATLDKNAISIFRRDLKK